MKVFIIHKRSLIAVALILCFTVVFILAVANLIPATAQASAQNKKLPIYSVDKQDQKICSISFDAAWWNVILEI